MDLENEHKWLTASKLTLNKEKTEYTRGLGTGLGFGLRQRLFNYNIEGGTDGMISKWNMSLIMEDRRFTKGG